MPYTLTVATPEDRDLVVAALRGAANQRLRVARTAGGEVAREKRQGADVRSAAVRVTMLLAEADALETIAADLEAAEESTVVRVAQDGSLEVPPTVETIESLRAQLSGDEDDGTSLEAQALAELAGLTAADPDAVEDELGRLPEDLDVAEVEEVLS